MSVFAPHTDSHHQTDPRDTTAEAQAGSLPTSDVSSNPDEWAEFVRSLTLLHLIALLTIISTIAPPTRREILRFQQSS